MRRGGAIALTAALATGCSGDRASNRNESPSAESSVTTVAPEIEKVVITPEDLRCDEVTREPVRRQVTPNIIITLGSFTRPDAADIIGFAVAEVDSGLYQISYLPDMGSLLVTKDDLIEYQFQGGQHSVLQNEGNPSKAVMVRLFVEPKNGGYGVYVEGTCPNSEEVQELIDKGILETEYSPAF